MKGKVLSLSLRDFLSTHREELLRACAAELKGESSIEQLARELADVLERTNGVQAHQSAANGAPLLGEDAAIKKVRVTIERLAQRSRMPVLFFGETGTGKRHSARLLHARTYPDGEFFELKNDEQLPLLERRLAALRVPSSRQAIGGMSVFVNEVSESSKAIQAALVKLLAEHQLRFRLLVSSRTPLTAACREGILRSDLVFGISSVVELPSLRDRLNDLSVLVAHFSARSQPPRRAPLVFSDAALEVLSSHSWPGNLLELSQLIERLQRLDVQGPIEPQHLTELGRRRSGLVVSIPPSGIDLANLERELLLQALALADNNRTHAARLLGLTRDQIRYRMSKLSIPDEGAG